MQSNRNIYRAKQTRIFILVLKICSLQSHQKLNIKLLITGIPQVEGQHATCEGRGHTKIPRGFPGTTQLLDLRSNHFHYVPSNSFKGASNVVSLHLELCKIHEVESGAFSGMGNLLYLYLSDNDLTSLDPEAFKGTPELTYLHLDGNRLLHFPGIGE